MQTTFTKLANRSAAFSGWFYGFAFWYPTGISGQETGEAA